MLRPTNSRRVLKQNGAMITYTILRKQVKNINLRIKADGCIMVSASPYVPVQYLDELVLKNFDKILETQQRLKDKHTVEAMAFETGGKFMLLGKSCTLIVEEGKTGLHRFSDDCLYLKISNPASSQSVEKEFNRWIDQYTEEIFTEIAMQVYGVFRQYDIEFPQIRIRKMKSRWGSCHVHGGIITLNSRMIEAPRAAIEYVVVHEFAHFLVANHSKEFHQVVAGILPDWKARKELLKTIVLR